MMTTTVTLIAITTMSFGVFCRTNSKHSFIIRFTFIQFLCLFCFLGLTGSRIAFLWDCHSPFLILLPTPKHPDLIHKCSYLHTAAQGSTCLRGKMASHLNRSHIITYSLHAEQKADARREANCWFLTKHLFHFTYLAGKEFGWPELAILRFSALSSPIINTTPQAQSPKDIGLNQEEIGV